MKLLFFYLLAFNFANAALVGKKAPEFELSDENNNKVTLTQFKGKIIILEWLNHGCPFIKKHYKSGNMQATQKKVIDKNTVWLSIISSAKGKQGYSSPSKAKSDKANSKSLANHILLDTNGNVGQLYQAKTTPHMFIINKKGIVAYEGAIDSIASADSSDIPNSENYILAGVKSLKSGTKIKKRKTRAYGCSVKY